MARRRASGYQAMGPGMFANLQQRVTSQHLRSQHLKTKPARAHEPLHLNKAGHAPQVPFVGQRSPLKAQTAKVFTEDELAAPSEWVPMDSSRVRQARYDYGNHQVHVIFRDGTPWVYDDVPADEYQQFIMSPSPGRFIDATLNGYPYRRGDFA